jgi:hypothetical protein
MAGLISRMAAARSTGVVSQCGSGGRVVGAAGEVTVTALAPFRKDSLLGGRAYGADAFQARVLTRVVT